MKIRTRRKSKIRLNQKGQTFLEYLFLLSIIVAVWVALTGVLKKDFFNRVFGQPWARLANEIEFGVPTSDAKYAGARHPASWSRHSTHSQ